MQEAPNIFMQCPKCGKRFPLDRTYCEKCSAMLEPVEAPGEKHMSAPEDGGGKSVEQPAVTNERMEDVKIDQLRADIENKFVYALVLETDQLKKRLEEKEKHLAEAGGRKGLEEVSAIGEAESSVDDLMKKITRLEMTLDSLKHKLTQDISTIDKELGALRKPGPLGLLKGRGRYLRMLASELKTKKLILDVIDKKKSPASLRPMYLIRPAVIVSVVSVIAVLSVFFLYNHPPGLPDGGGTVSRTKTSAGKAAISEKEIAGLLEDIKTANLKKDLPLWESRYSRGYLSSDGKKGNIADQWEKVNYKSLSYKIEDLKSGPAHASATVVWDVEFSPRKSTAIKKITQRLRADFALEDGRLKITSVVKEEP